MPTPKYIFTASNGQLNVVLDNTGNVFAQNQSFEYRSASADLYDTKKILLRDYGNIVMEYGFQNIGTIGGVTPTDISNAYELILALIPSEGENIVQDLQKTGTTNIVFNGTDTVFNIPHGLGVLPGSFSISFGDASNLNFVQSHRSLTSTNIVIECDSPPVAGEQDVFWQVWKNNDSI